MSLNLDTLSDLTGSRPSYYLKPCMDWDLDIFRTTSPHVSTLWINTTGGSLARDIHLASTRAPIEI